MNIKIHLEYKGSSKILKRICQTINYLSENASGDMLKATYDTNDSGVVDNAEKVNGHSVYKDVPSDAVFTDTVYDETTIRGQVRANMNNIELLMNALFNQDAHWLVDADGNQIIDSNGNPIYTAKYSSQLEALQNQVNILIQRLDDLGLSVVDGMLQVTYKREGED